eukprot:GCRY01005506.1.p2 GENE.GCRY01005506.1~~GCRY01005506.1.p2  ORF type:complete len:104 (+),score=7.83 GCRY01005506.1:331-642(+)
MCFRVGEAGYFRSFLWIIKALLTSLASKHALILLLASVALFAVGHWMQKDVTFLLTLSRKCRATFAKKSFIYFAVSHLCPLFLTILFAFLALCKAVAPNVGLK